MHIDRWWQALLPLCVLCAQAPAAQVSTWTVSDAQPDSGFGWELTAGDFNGDGLGDLVIGAPWRTGIHGDATGRVTLYLGAPGGPGTAATWTREGDQVGELFGTALSFAGDVNGDGFEDLVVGSNAWDAPGAPFAGRVHVLYGSPSGMARHVDVLVGDQAFATFGSSASGADVDGDGYSDVLVGTPYFDGTAGTNVGRVQVFRGSAAGVETQPAWTIEGNESFLGGDVFGVGDVNGDGYDDILAHAGMYANGPVVLFHGSAAGPSGAPDWSLPLGPPNWSHSSFYGLHHPAAGDFDGDGYADLVLSRGQGLALVRVFPGSAAGLGQRAVVPLEVEDNWDSEPKVSAGDLNGDGLPDLLVGDSHTGEVRIFFGARTGLAPAPSTLVTFPPNTSVALGWNVAFVPDADGDGHDDFAARSRGELPGGGRVDLFTQPGPFNYCSPSANSVSPGGASIFLQGSLSITANDHVLSAAPVPDSLGLFYFGNVQDSVPFGDGTACVGGTVYRLQPTAAATQQQAVRPLDFTNPLTNESLIQPGETWNFQYWFRDAAFGGAGFNYSAAVSATFDR